MKHFILTLLLVTLSTFAFASSEDDTEAFTLFLKDNKEFHSLLNLRSERVFRLTYPTCVDPVNITRLQPTILLEPIKRPERAPAPEDDTTEEKAVLIDGNTQVAQEFEETEDQKNAPAPIYGQWIERVTIQSCDQKSLINHLVVAYTKNSPVILPLINGRTKLDAIDQPFAEKAIIERLKKLERPCDTLPFTVDSNIIGYRARDGKSLQKTDDGYGWFERWTIRACGANYQANIAILPDPQTRYKYIARLKEIE